MIIEDRNELNKFYTKIKRNEMALKDASAQRSFSKTRDRLSIINLLAVLLTIGVIGRLAYLNTAKASFLERQLNTRILRTITIPAMRGTIVDRNGQPLAVSTPVDAIWADPSSIETLNPKQLDELAKALGITIQELNIKLADKNKTYVYLKRAMSPDKANGVMELDISGIYKIQEYRRFYPSGEVTAHVVGFNNIDDQGVDGMEYKSNQALQGVNGSRQIMRDLKGNIVNTDILQNAKEGAQISLSIDSKIQYIAYNALKAQVEKSQAKSGSAVVLDAHTGEVLAMVNFPTYNPNNRNGITPDLLKNSAAVNAFDPGSTIKPIVVAKALDDGLITPNTSFNINPYYVGPKRITDDHQKSATATVSEIIQRSSNVGTSKIGMMFKPEYMWNYFREVGLGTKLNTGFPGETNGVMLPWKKWYPIDQALMSFGYGITASLMQMAHAYTLFTNNGCLLPITFDKVNSPNDLQCQQLITPKTAETMRLMLSKTVEEGTGRTAQTADYTAAGKTGTAQVLQNGRYLTNQHIGSFVGFAPAKEPRIIVAVTIDSPKVGSYYGAQTASPVFANIVDESLKSLKVKPDKIAVAKVK